MKGRHKMKENLYMVIASYQNSIRNNLEIVDYNLTFDEAADLVIKLQEEQENNEIDEDWLIDDICGETSLQIVRQGERI